VKRDNLVLAAIGVLLLAGCVFLAIDDPTTFFTQVAAGIALGAVYSLVSLGFVVVYRATGVVNFAQVGLVLFGAFFTQNVYVTWGWPFWPSVLASIVVTGLLAVLIERVAMRRMTGRPLFYAILLSIAIFLVFFSLVTTIWIGFEGSTLHSPWFGGGTHTFGDVAVLDVDIATIVAGAAVLLVFFGLFRFTKMGLAMRATAIDQEAALAQGIRVPRVIAASWAIAGVVAVVTGVMLGSGAEPKVGLSAAGISTVALAALPAMVLGGLDSPGGAVVGGLMIGLSYELFLGYQDQYFSALGVSFANVMPYLVMIIVLMVRPWGLFGTRDVRRV